MISIVSLWCWVEQLGYNKERKLWFLFKEVKKNFTYLCIKNSQNALIENIDFTEAFLEVWIRNCISCHMTSLPNNSFLPLSGHLSSDPHHLSPHTHISSLATALPLVLRATFSFLLIFFWLASLAIPPFDENNCFYFFLNVSSRGNKLKKLIINFYSCNYLIARSWTDPCHYKCMTDKRSLFP